VCPDCSIFAFSLIQNGSAPQPAGAQAVAVDLEATADGVRLRDEHGSAHLSDWAALAAWARDELRAR
jgi:hypothetical protein